METLIHLSLIIDEIKFTIYNNYKFIFLQPLFGNINSKIIVKVENEIVTNYDLKNKILTSLFLSGQEISQKNIDDLKETVLDQLIF